MIDKTVKTLADAVAGIRDGSTVMIGGFGGAGQPAELIDALIEQGAKDLVIVNNNAGNGDTGLAALLKTGGCARSSARSRGRRTRTSSTRCTAPAGSSSSWCRRATSPSGSARPAPASARSSRPPATAPSSRRARRRGASTAATTCSSTPIRADVALVKALRGDRWGNLVYRKAARNFNPIMATAAAVTVAQVSEIVELGALDPEHIVTPGIHVTRVVRV